MNQIYKICISFQVFYLNVKIHLLGQGRRI